MPLNAKQLRFAQEYIIDLNATQAAIRAGYSAKTAKEIGYENLTKPHISAEIARLQAEVADRHGVTVDRIVRELAILGFTDMGDYMRIDGGEAWFDWSALPEGATRAISEITQETTPRADGRPEVLKTKFKLYNKRDALVDLGKWLGMFIDRHEVNDKRGIIKDEPLSDDDWTGLYGSRVVPSNGSAKSTH